MYLNFYNLKEEPFKISTDPKFLWLGKKHEAALATLEYGIAYNKGILLLTGDVGTGKTTLINKLLGTLDKNTVVATISDPGLEKLDLFNFIADAFKINNTFSSKGSFLINFRNFLYSIHSKNKRALLIVDEVQRLSHELLEEMRLLSNIEKQDTKLLNIFFIGQSEINSILLEKRNRALRQRITINYTIYPLSESETEKYINYRLRVAGSATDIFTLGAIREIYNFSSGYPRLINVICDLAMLTGYVQEKKNIDEDIVSECAEELTILNHVDEKETGEQHSEVETSHELLQEDNDEMVKGLKDERLECSVKGYEETTDTSGNDNDEAEKQKDKYEPRHNPVREEINTFVEDIKIESPIEIPEEKKLDENTEKYEEENHDLDERNSKEERKEEEKLSEYENQCDAGSRYICEEDAEHGICQKKDEEVALQKTSSTYIGSIGFFIVLFMAGYLFFHNGCIKNFNLPLQDKPAKTETRAASQINETNSESDSQLSDKESSVPDKSPHMEKSLEEKKKTTLSPGKITGREPTTTPPDPNKIIDWLVKKRSEKGKK